MNEKSKKALLVAAFISIFAIGIFAGKFITWLEGPDKRIIYEAQLNGALKTANKYGLEYVYLKDLTDFEWERVCVIWPYISNEDIKRITGVKYYDFTDHEGQWGLLFINKNKNLIPIRIERGSTVDYAGAYDDKKGYGFKGKGAVYCAAKDNAKLVFYFEKLFDRMAVALVNQ